MYCHLCETQMPDDSRYCRMCGVALTRQGPDPGTASRSTVAATMEVSAPSTAPGAGSPQAQPQLALQDLPPMPVYQTERRKRKRRRPWYQKLATALRGSLGTLLKLLALLAVAAVVIAMMRQ